MTPRPRLALALLVLSLGAAGPLVADEKGDEARRRTIAVTGRGEVRAPPDRATLSLAVETTGAHAGEAATENARRSTAVVSALRAGLVPDAVVTTSRYTVEPRYETTRPGESAPRITGYVVRNQVTVEKAPIDRVGALVDAAVTAGANRIEGLTFSFSKQDELTRAALEKAGADARAQAESVARGLGVHLKEVVTATTSTGPIGYHAGFAPMTAEMRAAPTPVEAGEATVAATLQVTYAIE
jgi:uncharacterized protein YggE